MKSPVLIVLALLLTTAILAPSVITLMHIDKTDLVIDFNEEKEEKKEAKEKDFFLDSDLDLLAQLQGKKASIFHFYSENEYTTSLAIFLPPPEHIV